MKSLRRSPLHRARSLQILYIDQNLTTWKWKQDFEFTCQLFLVHALRITKQSFLNNRKSSDRTRLKCNFFVFNRKFATSKPLESLVHGTFADVMCPAIDKEGGKPFDPYPKLTLLIYNLLSPMAFGKTWVVLGTSIWWYPAISLQRTDCDNPTGLLASR